MGRNKQMTIERYNPYEGKKIKVTNTTENKIPLYVSMA